MSYHQFHHNPHQFIQDLPQESLLFGIDLDSSKQDSFSTWDDSFPAYPPPSPAALTASPASTSSQLSPPQPFSPNAFPEPISPSHLLDYSSWLVDDLPPVPPVSAPIAIRPGASSPPSIDPFAFNDPSPFDKLGAYSPSLDFASLVPMPSSSSSFDPTSFSPMWASPPHEQQQQQDTTTTTTAPHLLHTAAAVQPPFYTASSFDDNASTVRPRHPAHHRHSTSLSGVFQSASAPSDFHRPALTRPYSSSSASAARRAESVSLSDDRDATVRRKRKPSEIDADEPNGASSEDRDRLHAPPASPRRSHLRPPKLAPSTWQLWFADWIQRQQATSDRKLNVAQAAKEAGIEYGKLSPEEKEPYTRRSQQLKDQREKEHALWMQSLSPDDIKRENNFRAAQRKAGRSRRGNIKDPNAPKKPLSAYFNFIQYIRSDAERVREVFGDETETTRQSVLAAQKWRSMTDDEKRPFLAQAEHDRLEYDAAKKVYDEQTTGHSSGVSFSVYQGGGFVHSVLRPVPVPTQAREASASSESDDSESDSAGRRSGSSRARV